MAAPAKAFILACYCCLGATTALRASAALSEKDRCFWYTFEPTLCPQGSTHWSDDELREAVPEFAQMFKNRPLKRNFQGVGVNHAFSLWFSVRRTQPKYIIESGVFRGFTTWLMRQAAPQATIFCLDPRVEGELRHGTTTEFYHDNSSKTHYYRGTDFKDLNQMDWDSLIPHGERDKVFVMLDDHMSAMRRAKEALSFGFLHMWYDDNQINGDSYSFNKLCSVPGDAVNNTVLFQDDFGTHKKRISLNEHSKNQQWLSDHTEIYFEFPALWDHCVDHTRQHSLFHSEEEVVKAGLPTLAQELPNNYGHFYTPYVKLRP